MPSGRDNLAMPPGTPAWQRTARLLAEATGDVRLESGTNGGKNRTEAMLDALDQALAHDVVEDTRTALGDHETTAFRDSARDILARLGAEGPAIGLDVTQAIVLEAIVHTDGTRPALLIRDGFVDPADPAFGRWAPSVLGDAVRIRDVIAATGRVLLHGDTGDANVYGTAWMIAPGRVATAQHVLELMAVFDVPSGKWLLKPGFTVDFGVESGRAADPARRFRVAGIERPGPDFINNALNLANLDAAVLRLAPNDLGEMPDPITLSDTELGPDAEPRLYIVGHPRRLEGPWVAETEALAGTTRVFRGVLEALLGHDFGVKRFSPGLMEFGTGMLPGDGAARVISHDATTLGGNSGGPVLDFTGAPHRAIGLHFGGRFRERNYALSVPAIADHLTGQGQPPSGQTGTVAG